MKNKEKIGVVFSLLAFALLSFSIVSAFGANTPYWDERPLRLAPGESTVVELTLQNKAGEKVDMTLKATINGNSQNYARIADESNEYFVPFGSEVPVSVLVEIPLNEEIGSQKEVYLTFSQVSSGEGGMVKVAGKTTSKFPVIVSSPEKSALYEPPKPEKEVETSSTDDDSGDYIWWIVIAIVLILIAIYFLAKPKKKK